MKLQLQIHDTFFLFGVHSTCPALLPPIGKLCALPLAWRLPPQHFPEVTCQNDMPSPWPEQQVTRAPQFKSVLWSWAASSSCQVRFRCIAVSASLLSFVWYCSLASVCKTDKRLFNQVSPSSSSDPSPSWPTSTLSIVIGSGPSPTSPASTSIPSAPSAMGCGDTSSLGSSGGSLNSGGKSGGGKACSACGAARRGSGNSWGLTHAKKGKRDSTSYWRGSFSLKVTLDHLTIPFSINRKRVSQTTSTSRIPHTEEMAQHQTLTRPLWRMNWFQKSNCPKRIRPRCLTSPFFPQTF